MSIIPYIGVVFPLVWIAITIILISWWVWKKIPTFHLLSSFTVEALGKPQSFLHMTAMVDVDDFSIQLLYWHHMQLLYCIHRNFSDLTIIVIIAIKLKTLLLLNAIYSRLLFLVFIKEKILKFETLWFKLLLFWKRRYSFRMLKFLCIQFYSSVILGRRVWCPVLGMMTLSCCSWERARLNYRSWTAESILSTNRSVRRRLQSPR